MRQTLSKGMVAAAAATGILSLYNPAALADSDAKSAAGGLPDVVSGNTVQALVRVPANVCGKTVDVAGLGNRTFGNSCVGKPGSVRGRQEARYDALGHEDKHHEGRGERGSSGARGPQGPESSEAHGRQGSRGSGKHGHSGKHDADEYGAPEASKRAHDESKGAHGIGSGNVIQVPVDVPVHTCGNNVDVISALNRAFGDECYEAEPPRHHPEKPEDCDEPEHGHQPPAKSRVVPPGKSTTGSTTPGKPSVSPPAMAETGSEGALAASAVSAVLIAGGALLYRRSRAASHR